MGRQPEVLFVCVHNAGRSQMAAGLLTLRSRGQVKVGSAGSDPAEKVNPLSVEVMAELGVDLAAALPTRLTDDAVRAADVVITMGCGDACPIYLGKRYEDWQVDDPSLAPLLDDVRRIRDDIDARVQRLLADLAQTQRGGRHGCPSGTGDASDREVRFDSQPSPRARSSSEPA